MASSPTSVSAALVRGKVARFTLLDICGNPQTANSCYVTDGIITVNNTKNMDAGDEIKVRQMNGIIGVHEPGRSSLLNYTIDVNFTKMDVGALAMLTGDPAVLNAAGTGIVGFTENALQQLLQNFALEVWTDSSSALCSTSRVQGYMLYPLVSQAYLTIDNIADKEVTGTIHGMSYGNPQWGRGPYGATGDGSSILGPINTATSGAATPGRLLLPVGVNEHRHFEETVIPSPAAFSTPGPINITLPTIY